VRYTCPGSDDARLPARLPLVGARLPHKSDAAAAVWAM
jgi:hypothetical protein